MIIKTLLKNVAIISIFSIFTRALGFLFRIYLANKVGSETLGVFQIGFSIFMVFIAAVSSGLPLSISKLTAKYRLEKNTRAKSSAVSTSMVMGIIVALVLFVTLLIFKGPIMCLLTNENAYYVLLTLAPALLATAIGAGFRGSLWGQQKHLELSISELIEEIAKMLLTIILLEWTILPFSSEISVSFAITISAFICTIIVSVFYFKNSGKLFKPQKQYYKLLFKSAAPITGMRVVASLIQPFIAIIIPFRLIANGYTESQALSQLGIALGMTFPLLFLPLTIVGALSTTIIPELSSLLEQNNIMELKNRIISSLSFTLFSSFLFLPAFMGLGVPIGEFLFSNTTSGVYLVQAAFIMIPISLSNLTSSILNALNLEVKSFKNYILGSLLLIISLWFLPKFIGVRALIWGMALCMISVSILNLIMIHKKTNFSIPILKPIIIMSLFIIPSSLLCKFSFTLFSYLFPTFLALLFSAGLGTIMFLLLCIVFNLIKIDFWALKIKNILNAKILKRVKNKSV